MTQIIGDTGQRKAVSFGQGGSAKRRLNPIINKVNQMAYMCSVVQKQTQSFYFRSQKKLPKYQEIRK